MARVVAFIADLHLDGRRSDHILLLRDMLDRLRRRGLTHLYILGDLFNYWYFDRQVHCRMGEPILVVLRELAAEGVRIAFVAGNRDFQIISRLKREPWIEASMDPLCVQLGGCRAYLSHGDELCIHDEHYQRWRRVFRHPLGMLFFRLNPRWIRNMIVNRLRMNSRRKAQRQGLRQMQVPQQELQRLFEAGYEIIIHGHTHQDLHDRQRLDGRVNQRFCLPDWQSVPNALVYREGCDSWESLRLLGRVPTLD